MKYSPRTARKRLGRTQEAMAEIMGVHKQTWVKWEHNTHPMTAAARRLLDIIIWLTENGTLTINDFEKIIKGEQKQ